MLSLPGTESSINKFIVIYKYKPKNDFKNPLVVCFIKDFSKMSGEVKTVYSPNVLNLYMALSATSFKTFDFVSRKLFGPAIHKIKKRRIDI